eukprot:TRINITY_DN55523_c0_g1_i1.p1 TRINITY_DN55523_c0_g1~~TRINITY_DN55523_c0_g1_i1.p1  ORF type:complete len:491 (+),score=97.02 TRINITY_DN55523_c0_g1_i1:149-1474(+)
MFAAFSIFVLLGAEVGEFLRPDYDTDVSVDANSELDMHLHFKVHMWELPCKYLKVAVWDKYTGERMDIKEKLTFIPLDGEGAKSHKGSFTSSNLPFAGGANEAEVVSKEEQEELDADWTSTDDHFKHNDFKKAISFHSFTLVNFYAEWCGHCRTFFPMWQEAQKKIDSVMKFEDSDGQEATVKFLRINCVDFGRHCSDAGIMAFPTMRLYKHDGTFEVFQNKRSIDNIINFLTKSIKSSHQILTTSHSREGCVVKGNLKVPRVPGHVLLQAEAYDALDMNPTLTNVSHTVDRLTFSSTEDREPAHVGVFDGRLVHVAREQADALSKRTFITKKKHEAPQHYLKVVSTQVEGRDRVFYQYSHADVVRKFARDSKSGNAVPQARFSYEFSPMSVTIRLRSKRWYDFITTVFAVLGGTYTVLELCGGAANTVGNVVKEALGKQS